MHENKNWKSFIRETFFEGDNPSVARFEIFILIIILLSILAAIIETIPGISTKYYDEFYNLEWLFTIIFTIEYLLRVITAKKSLKFIFSWQGLIDLIATLPLYVRLMFSGKEFISLIRLLRVARIFSRLGRFTKSMKKSKYFLKNMESHLGTHEHIIKYFKRTRLKYLIPYTIGISLFILSLIEIVSQIISESFGFEGNWVKIAGYIIFLLSITILIIYEIKIIYRRFAITNHRVIMNEGILHENFKSTTYHYITDTDLFQTLIDKILNTGLVRITTTGSETENLNLKKIRNPIEIKKIIQDNIVSTHKK
ncbi:ion transporter [Candidatus Woesearchaeota archaeon]|nr:ion transporter [Candidatus Woesearchaeota archaeon]MCF7901054.1 ion transporter [Candidatus Woesearchaeota archaeon]MCF8013951.1 ion transporter [Candidatus Woesearchaeota archaeon]